MTMRLFIVGPHSSGIYSIVVIAKDEEEAIELARQSDRFLLNDKLYVSDTFPLTKGVKISFIE